ncbi:MAG: type II toxin-antitoxin system VapB family antitoxin [Pseudonocardia sp.]
MALNIKDPETDRLARELAALTGQPITAALHDAIQEKLAAIRARGAAAAGPGLADIIARGRARRMLDERGDDEILGYGEDGLPA